ncbi:hypothetical protein [Mucilaginibacter sp. 5C4]
MLYEFLEWFVSIASGQSGDSFLGTQGYSLGYTVEHAVRHDRCNIDG